jgi:hypothetical protein
LLRPASGALRSSPLSKVIKPQTHSEYCANAQQVTALHNKKGVQKIKLVFLFFIFFTLKSLGHSLETARIQDPVFLPNFILKEF